MICTVDGDGSTYNDATTGHDAVTVIEVNQNNHSLIYIWGFATPKIRMIADLYIKFKISTLLHTSIILHI